MGLDNIPHTYACKAAGTAVLTANDEGDVFVNCGETMEAGGCPWKRESESRGTPVTGMLGTPCWYRGKAGNWMLDEVQEAGHTLPVEIAGGFYGAGSQEDEGPQLDPGYCERLATWMEDHAELFASLHRGDEDGGRAAVEMWRYGAWWLHFTGLNCEGSDVWF